MAANTTPDVPSPQLFSLKNTNVLITGASRGIGLACAIALAQAGARLCFVTRNDDPAAVESIVPGSKHVSCDLTDLDAVKLVFDRALEKMDGHIHVLVNCAGIQRRAPSVDFPEQDWDDVRVVSCVCVAGD